MVNQDYIHTKI